MTTVPFNNLQAAFDVEAEAIAGAMARVMKSGSLILGPEVEAFEQELAAKTGFGYAVGVANGTDAIELLMANRPSMGGADVLVPANSAPATVTAVLRAGCKPVYCEVQRNGIINPEKLGYFMTPETFAVLAVDLYGQTCDYAKLADFAHARQLLLYSDGAQSFGSASSARHHVNAQTLSFYPTKALGALGDGGAILTHDANLARDLKARRFYGIYDRKTLTQEFLGCNSRLDEMQAAILRERMQFADKWCEVRRKIAWFYHKWIRKDLQRRAYDNTQNYHIFNIHCEDREGSRDRLAEHAVQTAVHYPIPAHRQSPSAASHRDLPVTEEFCRTTLSLPIWVGMSDDQIGGTVEAVNELCK